MQKISVLIRLGLSVLSINALADKNATYIQVQNVSGPVEVAVYKGGCDALSILNVTDENLSLLGNRNCQYVLQQTLTPQSNPLEVWDMGAPLKIVAMQAGLPAIKCDVQKKGDMYIDGSSQVLQCLFPEAPTASSTENN